MPHLKPCLPLHAYPVPALPSPLDHMPQTLTSYTLDPAPLHPRPQVHTWNLSYPRPCDSLHPRPYEHTWNLSFPSRKEYEDTRAVAHMYSLCRSAGACRGAGA